jgi:hypothetical protein
VTLEDLTLPPGASARLLGQGPLEVVRQGTHLSVRFSAPLPDEPVHAIALEGAA